MTENLRENERKTNFCARASEVKRALFLNKPMIVLLYKEALFNTNQLDTSLPSSIISLLQKFEDVFLEEILKGLPPIRGIEHQIDFLPGATILNRPAYKRNPEETKELQKQVGELMEKGYVRESLSPCTVPVILVPIKDGPQRICIYFHAIHNIMVKIRGRIFSRKGGMMRIKAQRIRDAGASRRFIRNSILIMENSDSGGCETLETPNIFLLPSVLSFITILIWSCFILERFILQV